MDCDWRWIWWSTVTTSKPARDPDMLDSKDVISWRQGHSIPVSFLRQAKNLWHRVFSRHTELLPLPVKIHFPLARDHKNSWGSFKCRAIHGITEPCSISIVFINYQRPVIVLGTFTFTHAWGQSLAAPAEYCRNTEKESAIHWHCSQSQDYTIYLRSASVLDIFIYYKKNLCECFFDVFLCFKKFKFK